MQRCSVGDCARPVVSRGWCATHFRRFLRQGHVEDTRPQDWGERSGHPLYERWSEIRRRANVCEDWKNFWSFVEDVGQPPTDRHTLVRLNTNLPYNKENTTWRPPKFSTKLTRIEYFRKWREEDPEYFRAVYLRSAKSKPGYMKNWHLKKKYGITIKDYKEILEKQEGACAICKELETSMENGRIRALCVDHNSETKRVRGLLTTNCNRGIGLLKHSIPLLCNAILYLAKDTDCVLGALESALNTIKRFIDEQKATS